MLLDWFNAREATQVGTTLAECLLSEDGASGKTGRKTQSSKSGRPDLQKFLQRVAREAGLLPSSVGRWKNYEKFIRPLLELRKLG